MKKAYEKYIPFVPLKMDHRTWPDKQITKAPSGARWTCGTATRPWWTP